MVEINLKGEAELPGKILEQKKGVLRPQYLAEPQKDILKPPPTHVLKPSRDVALPRTDILETKSDAEKAALDELRELYPGIDILQLEDEACIDQIIETLKKGQLVVVRYPGNLYGIIGSNDSLAEMQRVKNRTERPFSGEGPAELLTQVFDQDKLYGKYKHLLQDPQVMEELFAGQAFVRAPLSDYYKQQLPEMAYNIVNDTFHLLTFANYPLYRELESKIYEALGQQPWILTSCNPGGVKTYKTREQAVPFSEQSDIGLVVLSDVKSAGKEKFPVVTVWDEECKHPSEVVEWLKGRFMDFNDWLEIWLEKKGYSSMEAWLKERYPQYVHS